MSMNNKKPLPMLIAGIAMIAYSVIEIAVNVLTAIINFSNYKELMMHGYLSSIEIRQIFGNMIVSKISLFVWMFLLAIVGVVFIISFIKPCKVLYIVSFSLLGALGLANGIAGAIGDITKIVNLASSIINLVMDGSFHILGSYLGQLAGVPFIHSLSAMVLAALALLSLIPKVGKAVSKLWVIPTVLSGLEFVLPFVLSMVFNVMTGMNIVGAITVGLFNVPCVCFTACILFAGLGMSSMVKNNFGKSAE